MRIFLQNYAFYALRNSKNSERVPALPMDISYYNDHSTSRSTWAYIFKLYNRPIIQQSKRLKLIAVSTYKAEYMATFELYKEALFLKAILEELDVHRSKPIPLFINNQVALKLGNGNQTNQKLSKHIRIRFHLVRQLATETKEIALRQIDTRIEVANLLTKPISPISMVVARELLGVSPSKV